MGGLPKASRIILNLTQEQIAQVPSFHAVRRPNTGVLYSFAIWYGTLALLQTCVIGALSDSYFHRSGRGLCLVLGYPGIHVHFSGIWLSAQIVGPVLSFYIRNIR